MNKQVKQIRNEVERLIKWCNAPFTKRAGVSGEEILNNLLSFIDSIEEPEVDLEKELYNWRHQHFHGQRDDKGANGEYLTRKSQLDLANYIAEWCMSRKSTSQTSISNVLDRAADQYSERAESKYSNGMFDSADIAEGFIVGAQWQKQQMTKDTIETTVKIDAGGYPYIPSMELYDYTEDKPLAKEGDKVKLVIIKEE